MVALICESLKVVMKYVVMPIVCISFLFFFFQEPNFIEHGRVLKSGHDIHKRDKQQLTKKNKTAGARSTENTC